MKLEWKYVLYWKLRYQATLLYISIYSINTVDQMQEDRHCYLEIKRREHQIDIHLPHRGGIEKVHKTQNLESE